MPDPFTIAAITTIVVKNTPHWLHAVEGTVLDKGKEVAVGKGSGLLRDLFHIDENEQIRHLERALEKATERGIVRFNTLAERDQYRDVLDVLSQSGPHSEALCQEALLLFTLSDSPNFAVLSEKYNLRRRISATAKNTMYEDINITPYLSSFLEALLAALYADPYFKQQMSDVLRTRAAMTTLKMERAMAEATTTLHQIRDLIADNYTEEQFNQDVAAYTAHLARTLHNLKIVGIVPKEGGEKHVDPELNAIFVPLRVELDDRLSLGREQLSSETEKQDPIIALLEQFSHVVLLGGPGSGKSTVARHLAWSHAVANKPDTLSSDLPLLSGKPLPLRIELRRLVEDRKQYPYDFLTYTSEAIVGRNGIQINKQMFKELLKRKNMLLLFDGLDEVATLSERQRLVEEIEDFTLLYPGNYILVTSRPLGYDLARCSSEIFTHAEIQNFNNQQIHQFLERWYTHVLRLSPIPYEERQELETLFKTLSENTRLHKLAENPLLLTVITALYRSARLPDKRVHIYDKCAELLLETWAKLKGTEVRWKEMKMVKEDQYACVAHLGSVLHQRSQEKESDPASQGQGVGEEDTAVDVPARFMQKEIENFLRDRKLITGGAEQRHEAKQFLDLIQVEAGLIVERGQDESSERLFGFVHRTFQEYFAAADVYERYQQEEDRTIISDFLTEHLHDPHWREVILLLLGKLKRTPATTQLRQILEGKIRSHRSHYTDLVQQDLFFVCECLMEEITVESELIENVLAHLKELMKGSHLPSQRTKVLEIFTSLMQTRQYADPTRRVLVALLSQNIIPDVSTRTLVAQTLYENSVVNSEERQRSASVLLDLVERRVLSFRQSAKVAANIYQDSSATSAERQRSTECLLNLAMQRDLSADIEGPVWDLLGFYVAETEERVRMILGWMEHPEISVESMIYIAYTFHAYAGEMRGHIRANASATKIFQDGLQAATRILLRAAHQNDIPLERRVQAIEQVVEIASPPWLGSWEQPLVLLTEETQEAIQLLLDLAGRPDLSFEQRQQIAQALCKHNREDSQEYLHALNMLWQLAHQPDLSLEQALQIAHALYKYALEDSKEYHFAIQIPWQLMLEADFNAERVRHIINIFQIDRRWAFQSYSKQYSQLTQLIWNLIDQSNLSFDQTLEIALILHQDIPEGLEHQSTTQLLLQLIQLPGVSIEHVVLIADALYQGSPAKSQMHQQVIQRLSLLLELPNLSSEQTLQIVRALYEYNNYKTEMHYRAAQMLSALTENQTTSIGQKIRIAQILLHIHVSHAPDEEPFSEDKYSYLLDKSFPEQRMVERQLAIQILLNLAQRNDLSFEETLQINTILYKYSQHMTELRLQISQILWQPLQKQNYTIDQRARIASVPFSVPQARYSDRTKAVHTVLELIQEDDARELFEKYWRPMDSSIKPVVSEIPAIVELVSNDMLPVAARDKMYALLLDMVPQYNKVNAFIHSSTL